MCKTHSKPVNEMYFGGASDAKGAKKWTRPLDTKKSALPAEVFHQLERAKRFELSTLTLARLCSTPELRPRPFGEAEIAPVALSCKG